MKQLFKLLSVLPALLALTLSAPAGAAGKEGGVGPYIPPAVKGKQCVKATEDMRKNHMKYLFRHRNEALREGIRTEQFSLRECLDCHVPPEGETQAARAQDGHFCQNCHAYAGVRIDCFECHATRPEKSAAFHPLVTPATQTMKDIQQPDSAALLNEYAENRNNTGAIQ